MRLTGVCMLSMDQDHASPGQHLLQLGIRLGCFTVVSGVPCARVVYCVARLEGEDSSTIDRFSSNDSREVFLGSYIGSYSSIGHIHCKISLKIGSRIIIHSGQK